MCTGAEAAFIYGIGAALSAGAAVHQGQAQKNQNEYLADQAEADARADAGMAQVEAARIRKQRDRQRSEAVAALVASGVNVDSGTALKIDEQIVRDSEEDAALTMFGSADRQRRLQAEAGGYRAQGSRSLAAGYVKGASLLIDAGTNSGRGWKRPGGS